MIVEQPTVARRIAKHIFVFDPTLLVILLAIYALSFVTVYSAAIDFPGRFDGHVRNVLLSLLILWIVANVPPLTIMRVAVPVYLIGLALLVAVALFGDVSKGARRWLNLGFARIQPSEIMKIAMPLMLAWYFQQREGAIRWFDFTLASILLAIPVALIARQPDLGTAILVAAAGAYVIFFAGLRWRVILSFLILGLAALWPLWHFGMKDYQRQRVMTLIDPTNDPLGKGFHIIQSMIAVGSGGIWGKGWMKGTQTHLEFIPERTTDFIFAVFSEELGLVGNGVLVLLYLAFVSRALWIAGLGANVFARLLAAALGMVFFTYAFVNMGMVTGILPVVGVPLPLMSYGGTALVTLGVATGLLMSISRNRTLVQT